MSVLVQQTRFDEFNFVNEARLGSSNHLSLCPLPQRRGVADCSPGAGSLNSFLAMFLHFGEVDLGALFTKEVAVQNQFAGVALFLQHALQFAVNAAFTDDGPSVDGPAGIEPVDAVDGLLKFVPGPGVAQEDDVVALGLWPSAMQSTLASMT